MNKAPNAIVLQPEKREWCVMHDTLSILASDAAWQCGCFEANRLAKGASGPRPHSLNQAREAGHDWMGRFALRRFLLSASQSPLSSKVHEEISPTHPSF